VDIKELERRHLEGLPFSHHQYVDVVFGGTANLDTLIEHTLPTTDPEAVNYIIVRSDRAVVVYHDQSATRRPWGTGYIVLKANAASAQVRLLLTLEP
jgi:hypothetical protein